MTTRFPIHVEATSSGDGPHRIVLNGLTDPPKTLQFSNDAGSLFDLDMGPRGLAVARLRINENQSVSLMYEPSEQRYVLGVIDADLVLQQNDPSILPKTDMQDDTDSTATMGPYDYRQFLDQETPCSSVAKSQVFSSQLRTTATARRVSSESPSLTRTKPARRSLVERKPVSKFLPAVGNEDDKAFEAELEQALVQQAEDEARQNRPESSESEEE